MAFDVKAFIADKDPAVIAELTAQVAKAGTASALVALASQKGIQMTEEEAAALIDAIAQKAQEEISIDDLDNVAGGCYDDPCPSYQC